MAFRNAKPAVSTWTVTITGEEIEPWEINGWEISDSSVFDFYVITRISGNSYTWGYEGCSIRLDEPGDASTEPCIIPVTWASYALYELYCEVYDDYGKFDSGAAFADIFSTIGGEDHVDWADLSAYGNQGAQYERGVIDCRNANEIRCHADVHVYTAEWAEAHAYFSWGGK
jgi:hypothetical protein